jgi:hypothetical protein
MLFSVRALYYKLTQPDLVSGVNTLNYVSREQKMEVGVERLGVLVQNGDRGGRLVLWYWLFAVDSNSIAATLTR